MCQHKQLLVNILTHLPLKMAAQHFSLPESEISSYLTFSQSSENSSNLHWENNFNISSQISEISPLGKGLPHWAGHRTCMRRPTESSQHKYHGINLITKTAPSHTKAATKTTVGGRWINWTELSEPTRQKRTCPVMLATRGHLIFYNFLIICYLWYFWYFWYFWSFFHSFLTVVKPPVL